MDKGKGKCVDIILVDIAVLCSCGWVISVYNGDRNKRLHGKCGKCGTKFEGIFDIWSVVDERHKQEDAGPAD